MILAGLLGLLLYGQSAPRDRSIEVGAVDLFGQSGLNAGKILAALSVHAGDRIILRDYPKVCAQVSRDVRSVVGKPATDVELIGRNGEKTILYIGSPGPTVLEVRRPPAPKGKQALPGYAEHSQVQVSALAVATLDADGEVRDNAVRALVAIARSDPAARKFFPVDKFLTMLRSGIWADRTSGLPVVEALTDDHDPAVLLAIRKSALPSLLEMARWHDPQYTRSALTILGRVAGIEEKRLQQLIAANDVITILASLSQD